MVLETGMSKTRRNISIDPELDAWLASDEVENASELVEVLLQSYRAYGGEDVEAARYTVQKGSGESLDGVDFDRQN